MNETPVLISKDVNIKKNATKLISTLIEHVTCLQCCQYYIAPETAFCGHTLCHTCWSGNHECLYCMTPVDRHTLLHNHAIQNLTQHVQALDDGFESVFKIKVAEVLVNEESENNPTKNVTDWLANSQNHFSAPAQSSERLSREMADIPLNVSSNKINTSKAMNPGNVVHAPLIPQDDWDEIEPMPDTEFINKEGKENVIGPMDIEPFYLEEDNEYTANNPRRSVRKRELKPSNEENKISDNKLKEIPNTKDSSEEADRKSTKSKQNWNNVKRMRKEFSKLNKKNRNKLNVSIEMCKKTACTTNKIDKYPEAFSAQYYVDENTPNNNLKKLEMTSKDHINEQTVNTDSVKAISNMCTNVAINDENKINMTTENNCIPINNDCQESTPVITVHSSKNDVDINAISSIKMPFYKKSALNPEAIPASTNTIKTVNHTVCSNSTANDDIEIKIKVGNTITNILIKNKGNVEVKVNTDREVQTSLCSQELFKKANTSKGSQTQNIVNNVDHNHKVEEKHQAIANPGQDYKKVAGSDKTALQKKNTDSADTSTAQFEITESVEKELSKVMDFEDMKPVKSKTDTTHNIGKSTKTNKSQKTQSYPDENIPDEYLNDLDIFDSESLKEPQVQCLKDTEHAPSEILLCTATTKNKTQKVNEKRCRGTSDGVTLPKSKKAKYDNEENIMVNVRVEQNKSKQNLLENEPMNYDAIRGTVFASIDADMEEIRESQIVNKKTYTLEDNIKKSHHKDIIDPSKCKKIQEVDLPADLEPHVTSQSRNKCNNLKDSENIFSVEAEKEEENIGAEPSTNKKTAEKVPSSNIDEFLTPLMSKAADNDFQLTKDDDDDDDSDKSVVEETPQKATSFTKAKQKSNGVNKDLDQSQRIEVSNPKVSSKIDSLDANVDTVVDVIDTSTEVKNDDNATVLNVVDRKPVDTPLTINKFVDEIQYKSTPCAKKSLNFYSQNVDDVTLCGTNDVVVNTTQEREFMIKAFEKTPTGATVRPQHLRNLGLKHKKFVIAGSCLTNEENANLKKLCAKNNWTYSNVYSKDITHLVVGVDEENKAQRTIKYMCALAAGKWIVSYKWAGKCLQTNDVVNEEQYEALDSTGDAGPMRSRVATAKLFEGITFFCMEPFGVLDVNTLKDILVAAGGKVVEEIKLLQVTDNTTSPALLLAEPENTQEDRFIYLAFELRIVPVNYEWALNCLGCYSLASIQGLLLCPASILPKATESWPRELMAYDDDEDNEQE